MTALEAIMGRASIRNFKKDKISEELIKTILKAGMAGPSCVNSRDWSFICVTDREMLNSMADINGKGAQPLKSAAFGVLICGDTERSFPPAQDYWIIDGSIAGQNMILAARELGIGSVWLGTWPQMDRVEGQKKLFELPENQIPHSIIAFGYPDEEPEVKGPEWEEDRVHFNRW